MLSPLFEPTYVQVVSIPLIAGAIIYLFGGLGRWLSRFIGLAAAAWMFTAAVGTLVNPASQVDVAGEPWVSYGIFQLGLSFHVDALRSLLLVAASLFALLIAFYSLKAADGLPKERRYWAFVLWAAAGASLVFIADNLWLLLIGWELTTVTLFLLANYGQPEARQGAFKTFAMLGFADAALLLGIALLLFSQAGTDGAIPALRDIRGVPTTGLMAFCAVLFIAAGVAKAGAMPLHTWLPAMAEKSPAAVFALLPASIDKLLGIFLLAVVGLQMFALHGSLQIILMALGAATILFAVMMAMIQHNLKRLLSFHAVSQVGYMVLGLGTGNPIGVVGGLFHMINHAIYKSDLFLMAGNVEDEAATAELNRLGGLARRLPVTFFSGFIAAMAISGIPPLNGFVSKWFVYQGVLERAEDNPAVIVFLIVAVFGSALTLASFVKVIHGVFMGPAPEDAALTGRGRGAARWAPMLVLALLCLGLGIFANYFVGRWLLPAVGTLGVDVSAIQTGRGTVATDVGYWSASLGTGLILIGILLGLLFWWITSGMKVRVTPTFVGGEALRSERFSGAGFYETIRKLPLLRGLYSDGEHGAYDGYRVVGQVGQALVNQLRAWHGGLLPVYAAWVLFGLVAVTVWLLIA